MEPASSWIRTAAAGSTPGLVKQPSRWPVASIRWSFIRLERGSPPDFVSIALRRWRIVEHLFRRRRNRSVRWRRWHWKECRPTFRRRRCSVILPTIGRVSCGSCGAWNGSSPATNCPSGDVGWPDFAGWRRSNGHGWIFFTDPRSRAFWTIFIEQRSRRPRARPLEVIPAGLLE